MSRRSRNNIVEGFLEEIGQENAELFGDGF
jgi:hypothetical protein